MIYGNYSLKRNDNDGNPAANQPPTWGGTIATPVPLSAQTPQNQGGATLAIPQHVHQLQEDLRELGFFMIQVVDGDFGRYTEWAVREFQIYAGMLHVAGLNRNELATLTNDPNAGETAPEVAALGQVPNQTPPMTYYVATLEQRTNSAPYTGPISGVVNQETRGAIEHWLANNYRCPVVIEAWRVSGNNRSTLYSDGCNIWRLDQAASTTPRVFFRDFTSYYQYPTTRNQSEYHVLGTYMTNVSTSGPLSKVPKHTWNEAELLPERLIGASCTIQALSISPNSPTTSTFRVVRAVSEVECMGNFDCVNAYDAALVSVGPCHWTLGLYPSGGYDDAELPAFLAYFLRKSETGYRTAFGNFGLFPAQTWQGVSSPSHWVQQQRKYVGWIRAHNDVVSPTLSPPPISSMDLVDRSPNEADYYKTWHWFFRYVMAGRTNRDYWSSIWGMVRIRLRDIRSRTTSITEGSVTISATIGEILTSEKSNALILRWHIFAPSHVSTSSRLDSAIASAISSNPHLPWSSPTSQWTDQIEAALTAAILSESLAVNNTHAQVADWPNYPYRANRGYTINNQLGQLRTERNSFSLDLTNI
ncbi:MAG: peptidoglycan-binding protein [Rhodocyclaceae bacterium]|nr:peptidoglycan-binding protein [Rhodocyclaceae bacterium]